MAGRAQDLAEEVEREKGVRESAAKTAKDKLKAAESAEKKAAAVEKNWHWPKRGVQSSWPNRMRRRLS